MCRRFSLAVPLATRSLSGLAAGSSMAAILAPNEAQGRRHRATSLDLVTEKRLTLASGSRLGAYQIIAPLGAGGMGEVYRARDTTLESRRRDQSSCPMRLPVIPSGSARFRREAQVLASLNHPNIAQIYGVRGIAAARARS